mmetsp:Transcript_20426/g.36629  ORF Transcript_20426/g.36629 Transcript_20426/m.36629 type:complete len:711 (-) Transcript_20426:51-2183(-)|eukprot:CAMPEP_0197652366 /NCGR_PEP_ID=MMETSP1338-20131121/34410_1 /TAXON_ID=43686 ORGANISM="Pelagodinium beii, Strain RCC1491" /NCGR_SAMPLE_ID=MMETSP1338 /ASSEMBLY_ACC=CAM_ASM_000754 /LENGTH=710 /DNA_ID=CAMNT_0043227233 /DNA_START=108 /DNA_END=2240 /DNA_ORIENTATION=-
MAVRAVASFLVLLLELSNARKLQPKHVAGELELAAVTKVPIKQVAKQIESLLMRDSQMNSPGSSAVAKEIEEIGESLLAEMAGRHADVQKVLDNLTHSWVFDSCNSDLELALKKANSSKEALEPKKAEYSACLDQVAVEVDKMHVCLDHLKSLKDAHERECSKASSLDMSVQRAMQQECQLSMSGWFGSNLQYWERFETKRAELDVAENVCKEAKAALDAASCDLLAADKVRTKCVNDFQPLAFCEPWLEEKAAHEAHSQCWTWAEGYFNRTNEMAQKWEPLLQEQYSELKQVECLSDLLELAHAVAPAEPANESNEDTKTIEAKAIEGEFTGRWVEMAGNEETEGDYLELPGPPSTHNPSSSKLGSPTYEYAEDTIKYTFDCKAATQVKIQVFAMTPDGAADSLFIKLGGDIGVSVFASLVAYKQWNLALSYTTWGWNLQLSPELDAVAGKNTLVIGGREDGIKIQKFKIASGQDSCSFPPVMYELWHTMQYCNPKADITTEADCKEAARKLGMTWKGKIQNGGGHKNCFYRRDGRDVQFNYSPYARQTPGDSKYGSVCYKKDSAPNPYDKDKPRHSMTSTFWRDVQQKIGECREAKHDTSPMSFVYPQMPAPSTPALSPVPTGTTNCRVAFQGAWSTLGIHSRCATQGATSKKGILTLETCKYACEADVKCKGIEFALGGHCVLYDETPSEQAEDDHSKGYTCVRYDG